MRSQCCICHDEIAMDHMGTWVDSTGGDVCMDNDGIDGPHRPSDGSALDVWDNLPPHLQEALRGALEGLSEAFEDHAHPFSPALQALWDVTDQIEAYALAQEQAVDTSGSTAVRSVEEHATQETFGPRE